MTTDATALERLARLVRMDCGASVAAKSVLLYAWNNDNPLIEFYKLDEDNRAAAIHIIDRPWAISDDLVERIVPEIREWQREVDRKKGSLE